MLASIPYGTVRWRDPRLRDAWLLLALAAGVALLFLPTTMTNGDEYVYAGEARMFLRGHLVPVDGDPIPATLDAPDVIVRYPFGWPLFLMLAAPAGFRAMFLVTLAAHLLGGSAVARMLVRRQLPSWLAAVYLFHPAFWGYSRTLMSDVPTVAAFLFAMDAWENRSTAGAIAGLGSSVLMRLASSVTAGGWALALLPELRTRWRSILALAAGTAAAGLLVLVSNRFMHGSATHYWYAGAAASKISISQLGQNALLYGMGLLLIPPCPLLCILIKPRSTERWALAALPGLAFFLCFAYHDASSRWLETLIAGQRLILATHAILLVATASTWGRFPLLRFRWLVMSGGTAAGVLGCWATRHLEERYGPTVRLVRDCAPQVVAYNTNASRAVLSADVPMYRMVEGREPTDLADLIVVALRAPTNRPELGGNPYPLPASLQERMNGNTCQKVGEFYFFDLKGTCPVRGTPCVAPASTAN